MRVLADTNLFISYLLRTGVEDGAIGRLFQLLADDTFTLLMPEDLLAEIVETVSQKPHLRERISTDQVKAFADLLRGIGEEVPRIVEPIPSVCRDPKDDYLLAYALVGQANYLVTGDKDLLVLKAVGNLKILTASQFLADISRSP